MYQVHVWNDDYNEYVPERLNDKGVVEFEHWSEAAQEATARQAHDGIMRKVEYRRARKVRRA